MNLKFLLEFDKWLKKNPQGGIFESHGQKVRVTLKNVLKST